MYSWHVCFVGITLPTGCHGQNQIARQLPPQKGEMKKKREHSNKLNSSNF